MGTLTTVNGKSNVVLDKFDSFGDMLAYANANPRKQQSDKGDKSFCETANYAEAHNLAVEGWHAVRPEVERIMSQLSEQIDSRLDMVSELEYATSGGAVDVGRWLTGEPECMYSFVPMPNERMGRVVKIFIDYGASASFSAEFIRQRGIVLCALVDALQKMRVACEVWGETAVTFGNKIHTTVVKLHDATAQMDIDELMFALANPSMLRRITFSVRELAGCGNNHSYGATIHTEYAVDYGADIRIERLKQSYDTMMQNPVEWVVSTIKGMELI
jgi:hypothetical protein